MNTLTFCEVNLVKLLFRFSFTIFS